MPCSARRGDQVEVVRDLLVEHLPASPGPLYPQDVLTDEPTETMIAELAAYEKEPDAAVATAEQLHAALFGPAPAVFALIAAEPGPDGAETVVGMAVYFRTFSTWTGTHGIWLEDLYVRPGVRGGGHGKQLLATLAQECRDNGYARLEWTEIDIERNPDAAEFVGSVNGGNHVVPTVLYSDGTTATNPSISDVKKKLGV